MTIYIETFLLQNILINLCLLRLVAVSTKKKSSLFKLVVASIIGSTTSLFLSIYLNNFLITNLLKITTACAMIILGFKQNIKQFFFNFILLFIYTYSIGGIIISFSSSIYITNFGFITSTNLSLEVICFTVIVISYLFELVLKNLGLKIKTNNLIYDLRLTQNNNSINIRAYLDTGNLLNQYGKPILLIDLNSYLKLTNKNLFEFYLTKYEEISTQTINGNKKTKIITIDKMEIKLKNKILLFKNQIVAINTNNCLKNSEYQALISPLFL